MRRKNVEEIEKNKVVHGGNKSGKVHTHKHKYIYAIWEKDTLHTDRYPGGYKSSAAAVEVYIGGVGRGR